MRKLIDLEKEAKNVIRLAAAAADAKGETLELCYSGGKDSEIMRHLAESAGVSYEAIYKQTTIDRPLTTAYCKARGVTIIHPPKTFLQYVERKGYPTRRCRWCCEKFKEYKIKNTSLVGVRRGESKAREKRYQDFTQCRIYHRGGSCEQFYPLLNWSELDELQYITENNIILHPHYYKYDGTIDITRRLGCIACPLRGDNGRNDFKEFPKMLRQWLIAGKKWYNFTHGTTPTKYSHPAKLLIQNLFFNTYEQYLRNYEKAETPPTDKDALEFLSSHFNIDLTDLL